MNQQNYPPDPEDYFADTRMSFGDHIEELRQHLWKAIIGFFLIVILTVLLDFIGLVTGWPVGVGVPVMKFMSQPVIDGLNKFYDSRTEKVMDNLEPFKGEAVPNNQPSDFTQVTFLRDQLQDLAQGKAAQPGDTRKPITQQRLDALKERTGLTEEEAAKYYRVITDDDLVKVWVRIEQPVQVAGLIEKPRQVVGKRYALSTLSVTEAMVVYFKVAIVCGIVLGSPWIFWQIWSFVAAGLYPHEKRYVHHFLPFSLGLFLGGVLVCEFLVMPKAVGALLWFNEWLDLEPDMRLNEWLSFAIWLPLIFGISFQTPLVMYFVERLGIWTIDTYRNKRRIAWFVMAVFCAFATPTPDAVTWSLMWVPMCGLYELGILLCRLSPRQDDLDVDVPDPEEMVEV